MAKESLFWIENHDRLVKLAAQKLTASEIGIELGITRNAVIGRARRTRVNLWYPDKHARVQERNGERLAIWNKNPDNFAYRMERIKATVHWKHR